MMTCPFTPPTRSVRGLVCAVAAMVKEGARRDLAVMRDKWLRRLESPRGRAAGQQCVARWEPSKHLACVLQERGNELRVLGTTVDGQLWLRPEEALCLLEDGLLLLLLDESPLSIQEAYERLLGTRLAATCYAVFSYLHRASFVSRPRSATGDMQQPPLLEVRRPLVPPRSSRPDPPAQIEAHKPMPSW